jgi:regulator of protease activity HflC (stomatin/prohibitin superfamily)
MFDTLLLIITATLAVCFLMLPKQKGANRGIASTMKKVRNIGFIAFTAITVIYAGFDMIRFVDQQDEGVLLTFGKANESAVTPGIKFIMPWQDIETLSVLQQEYTPLVINADGSVTEKEALYECASRDLQEVKTKMMVIWRRKRGKAPAIWSLFGRESSPMVAAGANEALKSAFAEYDATEAAQKRNEMKAHIDQVLSEWLEQFDHELVEVSLSDYVFTTEFQTAINLKREAYEDASAAENEVKKYEVFAQTAEAKAKGSADGTIEQARGNAEMTRRQADAKAYQIIRTAKADAMKIVETGRAEAIGIANLRTALQENPGFNVLEAIKAWKGGTSEFLLNGQGAGDNTSFLMNLPQGKNTESK